MLGMIFGDDLWRRCWEHTTRQCRFAPDIRVVPQPSAEHFHAAHIDVVILQKRRHGAEPVAALGDQYSDLTGKEFVSLAYGCSEIFGAFGRGQITRRIEYRIDEFGAAPQRFPVAERVQHAAHMNCWVRTMQIA